MKKQCCCISLILTLLVASASLRAQTGAVTRVHDPSILESNGTFYLFSTGRGIPLRSSTDLFTWKRNGQIFDNVPDWTKEYDPRELSMWAPDISFINGEYRVYYAVSSFGKTHSAIGLVVNTALDSTSPKYNWIDRGKVISTPEGNDWNAIDPCAFEDADGKAWLVLGSCWKGLKLVPLDRKSGLLADPAAGPEAAPISLAAHPPTNIIEEGYIRRHADYYYLWESVDHCCRGAASDYRILVGRSKDVRGPYVDRDGRPMIDGGGTLVLASYDQVRGPGSSAIVTAMGHDYLVHHEYDADNRGIPTLQIRPMFWATDGWPVVGEPIQRAPSETQPAMPPVEGDWSIRYDFGSTKTIRLEKDGTLTPGGKWRLDGSTLTLTWEKAAKPIRAECWLDDDGSFFVGRNADGLLIRAVRNASDEKPKNKNFSAESVKRR